MIDGRKRVIAYAAKRLSPAQRNYSATKGEVAGVLIILDIWRFYLQLRPFILRTDHNAISFIRGFKNPTGMLSRWQQRLEWYVTDQKLYKNNYNRFPLKKCLKNTVMTSSSNTSRGLRTPLLTPSPAPAISATTQTRIWIPSKKGVRCKL